MSEFVQKEIEYGRTSISSKSKSYWHYYHSGFLYTTSQSTYSIAQSFLLSICLHQCISDVSRSSSIQMIILHSSCDNLWWGKGDIWKSVVVDCWLWEQVTTNFTESLSFFAGRLHSIFLISFVAWTMSIACFVVEIKIDLCSTTFLKINAHFFWKYRRPLPLCKLL